MKKILFILNDIGGGGAERVFINIANGFVQHNIEVEMLLGKKKGDYFDILSPDIAVYELNAISLWDYIKKMPSFFRLNKYTHIFTAGDYVSAAAVITKKRMRLSEELIVTLHYHLPSQLVVLPAANRIWIKLLNKYVISKATKIVAVSNGVAEGFIRATQKKEVNITTIYNPVFDSSIYVKAEENMQIPISFENKLTLISIGRLDPWKNQADIIDAVAILKQKHSNIQLLILGKGTEEQKLKAKAAALGMNAEVVFLGYQPNPFPYLKKSKLLVLSSLNEGFGNVLVEAFALGKNVVSTDCPVGPSEILQGGKFGILCPVKKPEALADAIDRALENPIDALILQKRAEEFSIPQIIKQYLKVIGN